MASSCPQDTPQRVETVDHRQVAEGLLRARPDRNNRTTTRAMSVVGGLQAVAGFLRDRDDLSRERIAEMIECDWQKLNTAAEATPSIYGPEGRSAPTKDGDR
jgi:hypothetical protein